MGIDAAYLNSLQGDSLEIINQALAENPKVKAIWGLYSGGHDSLVSCFVASLHPLFRGVIHVNTKTSPSATLVSNYARTTAKEFGWNWIETEPFITFVQIITKYGFPSPNSHEFVYQYLKGRPLNQGRHIAKAMLLDELMGEETIGKSFTYRPSEEGTPLFLDPEWLENGKERKKKAVQNDVAFISGIRREESFKRSRKPAYAKTGGILWINPIIRWKKSECEAYIDLNELHRNRHSDLKGFSGECDCAAHAMAGEVDWKCSLNPNMRRYRDKLEELVRVSRELQLLEVEFGMRDAKDVIDEHDTVWGHGRYQKNTPTLDPDQLAVFRICSDCEAERDERVLEAMLEKNV